MMKPRVVYALTASVWIIAAALLVFIRVMFGSPYLALKIGHFFPPSGVLGGVLLYMLPQATSATLIIGTNVYLHRTIVKSKKKLENNLKLSGKDDHKVTRMQRLIHNLQMQLESSLPVFVLGGVDCIVNMLQNVVFVVMVIFYPDPSDSIFILLLIILPTERLQMILHSITYGVYQKTVRKKLHMYYQRLQRLFPPCPSKVVMLNS